MNMVTDCSFCGILDLNEAGFIQDVFTLLQAIIPAALCFTLWRIFVTNRSGPRGDVVVLGLDDSSFVYSERRSNISPLAALYCATSLTTFLTGLGAFELWKFLRETVIRL